jgi:hypothetical protein
MIFFALAPDSARAQTNYNNEIWPELDLHYRFNGRDQVIVMGNTSRERDSGQAYQAEVGAMVEHWFADWFSARVGYRYGQATDGGPFRENRLLAEQTFHMPIAERWKADFRTREDFRWLDTGYFMRFRERIQVTRDTTIGNYTFQPYGSTEIYYDTRYNQFARYRLIVGSTFPIVRHVDFEPYLAHQVDFAGPSVITDALGLILHISF